MSSSLTATKIKDTYGQVLHVDGGVTSTPKIVYDGDGTASALKVSTTDVQVNNSPVLTDADIGTSVQAYDADLTAWSGKTAPNGTVVGTTDTQTLSSKTFSDNPTFSAGTANGVAYLNGSKVLTTGSALTSDGTNLNVGAATQNGTSSKVYIKQSSDSGFTGLNIVSADAKEGVGGMWMDSSGVFWLGQSYLGAGGSYQPIAFNVGAGERMRLTGTGLGIGTSSPSGKLSVNGNLDWTGNTWVTSNDRGIFFDSIGSYEWGIGRTSSPSGLQFLAGGAERMRIDSDGNLQVSNLAGTGNRAVYSTSTGILTNSSSDRSLKENDTPISQGLDAVLAMRPISYEWIDKEKMGAQREIGFIAQEIKEIVPEVVGSNSDETLSIDYPKLVAVMAKAIQELKAELDATKAEVAALKGV